MAWYQRVNVTDDGGWQPPKHVSHKPYPLLVYRTVGRVFSAPTSLAFDSYACFAISFPPMIWISQVYRHNVNVYVVSSSNARSWQRLVLRTTLGMEIVDMYPRT